MVRGAAGDDDHLPDVPDGVGSEAKPIKNDPPVRAHPLGEGVGEGGGLLVDLLEHERLVACLFRRFLVPVDDLDLPLHHHAVHIEDLGARPRDDHHVPVLGEDHPAGLGQKGGDGRSQEVLAFAHAHHERGLFADPHDHVRLVHRYGAIGEVPLHLPVGLDDCLPQRSPVGPLYEMRDHLGVGLGGELMALFLELGPQAQIVLHDAVEHNGEPSLAVRVRMGVLVGRPAVGGPPGVSYAYSPPVAEIGEDRFEIIEIADGMEQLEAALVDYGDARGVVSPVFELAQASKEDVAALSVTDVADDPTHQKATSVLTALGTLPLHRARSKRPPTLRNQDASRSPDRPPEPKSRPPPRPPGSRPNGRPQSVPGQGT